MAKFLFDDGSDDINDYDSSGLPEEEDTSELDSIIKKFDVQNQTHPESGLYEKRTVDHSADARGKSARTSDEKTDRHIKKDSVSDGEKDEKKKKKKKKKRNRKPLSPKAKRVLTVVISVLLVFALTVTDVCGYVLFNMIKTVNGDIQIDLNEYKASQSQTTIIYAMENDKPTEIARLHGEENRIWVSLDKIPENLQNAYIALKNKKFK